MTDDTSPKDPLADAITRALDAAQVATDAAHEAEAVLTARSDAATAMDRTAKRTALMAGVAGGASFLALVTGTAIWFKTSGDLQTAAEVQATAAAAFVERLAEMNAALDRMDGTIDAAEAKTAAENGRLDHLIAMLDERLPVEQEQQATTPAALALTGDAMKLDPQLASLRADILAAIAEAELSMAERLMQTGRATGGSEGAAAVAPTVAARPLPLLPAAPTVKPVARPKPPKAQAVNPFRFP
jgi:hypothetical protein